MPDLSSTTWLAIAIFAGVVCLIGVFVWGPVLMRSIDWEPEHKTIDVLKEIHR